jgi:hypothetical protein
LSLPPHPDPKPSAGGAEAGFARARARYWNSLLFPLMLSRRKLGRARASNVALLPIPVERLFSACLALGGRLGEAGTGLPFGGSILATVCSCCRGCSS